MVTHLVTCPGLLRAVSSASIAPLVFFSFLTRASTAFSAHFSSSSPCFQPSRRFTAGEVKEKSELMPLATPDIPASETGKYFKLKLHTHNTTNILQDTVDTNGV